MSQLIHEVFDDGIFFRLENNNSIIEVVDWDKNTNEETFDGISFLLSTLDETEYSNPSIEQDKGLKVKHNIVADMSTEIAQSLNLPQNINYQLELKNFGTLNSDEFTIQTTWLVGGRPAIGINRIGSILIRGDESFRIPNPIYDIVRRLENFKEAHWDNDLDKLKAWEEVQIDLPPEFSKTITKTDYITRTRIAFASNVSIYPKIENEEYDFDPVLFSKDGAAKKDENGFSNQGNQLLTGLMQKVFVERFEEFDKIPQRLSLKGGLYVYFDKVVLDTLPIFKEIKKKDAKTREEFVKNPKSYLKQRLENSYEEPILEELFVETLEYSQKVLGVGVYERPSLPWIKIEKEKWIPDEFNIPVGDSFINLKKEDIEDVKNFVQEGIDKGQSEISWKDKKIPANAEVLDTLKKITSYIKPESNEKEDDKDKNKEDLEKAKEKNKKSIVLKVEENLLMVGFKKELKKRPVELKNDIGVISTLKKHQGEGLEWLSTAWNKGLPGVLLADDMGLGKTLQGICFVTRIINSIKDNLISKGPILIVAPTGLLANWDEEFQKHLDDNFYKSLNILKAYGAELRAIRKENINERIVGHEVLNLDLVKNRDIIFTTYESLRDYQKSLCKIKYPLVIYDEIQKVKTPGTLNTQAAKAVNAEFSLGLTGTPIENRLADLWNIIEILSPGLLGGLQDFSKTYEDKIDREQIIQLNKFLKSYQGDVPPTLLRRLKEDVLDSLPKKTIKKFPMDMPEVQSKVYTETLNEAQGFEPGQKLRAIMKIRTVSLHPMHPELGKGSNYIEDSARFSQTFKILKEIKSRNEKALIFIESKEMQPHLALLIKQVFKLESLPKIINGEVPGLMRQKKVNEFQKIKNIFDVILLSPRAAGIGLTLTAANNVIHLQRWWNPAVEDQCTDRVYRIGQEKDVNVYIPQSVYPENREISFDLKLDSLLERKRGLSRDLLIPPIDPSESTDELYNETINKAKGEEEISVSVEDLDAFEPLQFESWWAHKIKDYGIIVKDTPKTGDKGGDVVGEHEEKNKNYIFQLKHRNNPKNVCDKEAVDDCLRAVESYALESPYLVAVTNAEKFDDEAIQLAARNNVNLITRNEIMNWRPY